MSWMGIASGFVGLLATTGLAGAGGLPAARTNALARPNVLFIAVDDLKPMLNCYGFAQIESPNVDRLAERGMTFLNNSCQQALCGPSRASLMTGCYPDTTEIYEFNRKMRDRKPDILTIPQYFRRMGYATTGVGKVYDPRCVGPKSDAPSWSEPFDEMPPDRFFAGGRRPPVAETYWSPETRAARARFDACLKEGATRDWATLRRFPKAIPVSECLDLPDDAYLDGAIANAAVERLDRLAGGDKPFFLAVGFKKPHLPFVAPKKYWDRYDRAALDLAPFQEMPKGAPAYAFQDSWELRSCYSGIPEGRLPEAMQRELIHGYYACVSYVDAQIGKVLDRLKALGLERNTIVVLWGDHGWHLGDHGMWCKHSNYEQAVRSPLIVSAPGMKTADEKSDSPTEFVDLFPTLCELAGLPVPAGPEGRSLVPILDDPSAKVREAAMEQFPRDNDKMGYTLRDERYRYVKWVKMDYWNGERTGPTVAVELYDYEKDPLETVNLADRPEYKAVIDRFERLFRRRGVAQEAPVEQPR